MAEAKQKDLLKCKTRKDLYAFAEKNKLTISVTGTNILMIGGWRCVMNGNKFLYVQS